MPEWVANTPWWVVIGIIVTVAVGFFKFARWTSHVDTRLDTLTDAVQTMQNGLAEVRADIKKILERPVPRTTVDPHSPIQLNDFGREVSTTGSVNEWARTNAPNLEADAVGKEEFEVFDLCVSYVESLFEGDTDFHRIVRATAYQHGTEPEQILKVYQVELRDRLLPR